MYRKTEEKSSGRQRLTWGLEDNRVGDSKTAEWGTGRQQSGGQEDNRVGDRKIKLPDRKTTV